MKRLRCTVVTLLIYTLNIATADGETMEKDTEQTSPSIVAYYGELSRCPVFVIYCCAFRRNKYDNDIKHTAIIDASLVYMQQRIDVQDSSPALCGLSFSGPCLITATL